jgi:hypothetical protein
VIVFSKCPTPNLKTDFFGIVYFFLWCDFSLEVPYCTDNLSVLLIALAQITCRVSTAPPRFEPENYLAASRNTNHLVTPHPT